MAGPLAGYKVVELVGLGPCPFTGMVLADLGADVVRVDRPSAVPADAARRAGPSLDVTTRGRREVALDLKHPDGVAALLALVERADALIEGFRPGVMERLGVGPEPCLARNPRLVYGRVTGWGQDGPLASAAGHDINYISVAGALGHMRRRGEAPVPPLNLVGDFGGGGMLLAVGVLGALLEVQRSGCGQVVDATMVDGVALMMTIIQSFVALGVWDEDAKGANLLDTGAHYYDVYECADGEYVSVGTIEPRFYRELLERIGLGDDPDFAAQNDKSRWPDQKLRMAEVFRSRTRAEWCALLEGTDACVAPVLDMAEAAAHPHNLARGTFTVRGGVRQPSPAPRFSRTPAELARLPAHAGAHTRDVLTEWGVPGATVDAWFASGGVK